LIYSETRPISTVRQNLLKIEEPINNILKDTAEADQNQAVLRQSVHSSAKALAAMVGTSDTTQPDSTGSGASTASSETAQAPIEGGDVFYGSFDEWLASFTPKIVGGLSIPAHRLEYMREQRRNKMANQGGE
jgi:hypothetical protein